MTALLIVFMFVGFLVLDVVVRRVAARMDERQARRERADALNASVRLDFTAEAATLTRVRVPGARVSILAVDDERIVLESFRKILVLAGFNIDTVENGPDALGLVQRNDYDLVFTDLKMPGMDGTEVVKAVKHLRPDVDVAVITGYGTIETAVTTLQHGAVDYVQKPFTEDELVAFVRRLVMRRQARQEAERRPTVRLVSPAVADEYQPHEYYVPGGAFLAPGHSWLRIETSGQVRVGLDDLSRRALGRIDSLDLPAPGQMIERGQVLFTARRGGDTARFRSPVSGKIVHVNPDVIRRPDLALASPYDEGWVCTLQPSNLSGELTTLRIGQAAVDWYKDEIERLRARGGEGTVGWRDLEETLLAGQALSTVPASA